jgi:cell division protein FtsZ
MPKKKTHRRHPKAQRTSYVTTRSESKFQPLSANVKVIGVGGGGSNAVSRMAKDFFRGVDFIAINTDHQDLDQVNVRHKIYIGKSLTRGLGAGMNPDLGRQAAEENRAEIGEFVKGADLVFITAGFGGGTGTGAAPIIAETAKQAGALTIAVVTKPFAFEGVQRERIAADGIIKLKDKVDALIIVPNDRVFNIISKDTPILKAFEAIDDVLRNALKGLVEMIAMPGIINVDFADVKNVMQDAGMAIVGVGFGNGQERATQAVNAALRSPLIETTADGAKAILLGISGNRDLKMTEVNEVAKLVAETADRDARIIFGAYYDRTLKPNQIKVTIVATGLNGTPATSLFGAAAARYEPLASNISPMFTRDRGAGMPAPTGSAASGGANDKNGTDKKFGVAGDMYLKKNTTKEPTDEKATFDSIGKLPTFTPLPPKDEKKDKDKDDDAWDIPAFLRRRKK